MLRLENDFVFDELSDTVVAKCCDYQCSKNNDISEFFHVDYLHYRSQLLSKSYCFYTVEEPHRIACAFAIANASINISLTAKNIQRKVNKSIPFEKRRPQYPAVLVGRLAVFDGFEGQRLGYQLMDFIKAWFVDPLNKTGCRFLVVDAVNHPKVIDYYRNNKFEFLFDSVDSEREAVHPMLDEGIPLNTRFMYFDLIGLR